MNIIIVFIFLFNLYLSYRFGIKKKGLEYIAGFKNISTDTGREFVGNSIAIYLLIVDMFLLITLVLDIIGIQHISGIGIWDSYFYIFISITIIFILIINIYLKYKGGS